MTDKRKTKPVIANALVWASLMIASSLILKGDHKDSLMLLFIAGWFVSNQMLTGKNHSVKEELACIRGLFRKN